MESETLHCVSSPWKQPVNRGHTKFIFLVISMILLISQNNANILQLYKWTFFPHSYNLVFNNNGPLRLTILLNEIPHQWISKDALSSYLKNEIFFFNFKYVYLTGILNLIVHIFCFVKCVQTGFYSCISNLHLWSRVYIIHFSNREKLSNTSNLSILPNMTQLLRICTYICIIRL